MELNTGFSSLEESITFGYIPHTIERLSDGELLTLNKDEETYSFESAKKRGGVYHKYDFISLMYWGGKNNTDKFKVIGWINFENLKKKIIKVACGADNEIGIFRPKTGFIRNLNFDEQMNRMKKNNPLPFFHICIAKLSIQLFKKGEFDFAYAFQNFSPKKVKFTIYLEKNENDTNNK